jgi:hypothetical protein
MLRYPTKPINAPATSLRGRIRAGRSRRLNPHRDGWSAGIPDTALSHALMRAIEKYFADERHTELPHWLAVSLAGRTQLRRSLKE